MQFQHTGHKIKLNHSNALPRYLISLAVEHGTETIDISGKRIAHKFKSVSLTAGRFIGDKFTAVKDVHYDDRQSAWSYIYGYTRPNYTTWLVGHNVLSQLILLGLPDRLQQSELSIDKPRSKRKREDNDETNVHQAGLAVIESPPTIIACRVASTQGRIVIVDLANWFPGELSTIKAACGFTPAIKGADCDPNYQQSRATQDDSRFVHSAFENLIKWVKDNQMGTFRYTASAQALGAYRHRFMKQAMYVHDNAPIQELERRCYYGGRSEAFKLGVFSEVVYQLDVSGLFPSVMSQNCFPQRLVRSEQRAELIELLPSIDWSASCADVEIQTDKPLYPLRTDTHVIYPVGRFRTSLCGNELYQAFRAGIIRKCGSWSEYKLAPLFSLWVSALWDMRQVYRLEGNSLYEQFTKRIMNSLYGKFAQLTPAWVNVDDKHDMLPWTTHASYDCTLNDWKFYRSIGWQVQLKQGRKTRPQSFYAISAFVTAAARQRMDWLRRVAGKRHVLYQGVDSLIVTPTGRDNLTEQGEIQENTLGKLRLQYQSDYGYINGISDYQIGSKRVLSSRALNSEISDLGDVTQHKYYIMENLFKRRPVDHVEEKLEEWHRQSKYSKGIVGQDGWIEPFDVSGCPMSASDGVGSTTAAAAASCSNSGL